MRSIGKLQYQLSESALKKAKAELNIAKLNVDRCEIVAPYNGKVIDVYTSIFYHRAKTVNEYCWRWFVRS